MHVVCLRLLVTTGHPWANVGWLRGCLPVSSGTAAVHMVHVSHATCRGHFWCRRRCCSWTPGGAQPCMCMALHMHSALFCMPLLAWSAHHRQVLS